MKVKLIAPARKHEWGESFWDLKALCRLTGRRAGGVPLALPTLAGLTPPDVEVILTDENVEPIDFEEKVDLVGITGMTCVIPRAYEIADDYKKRGIPVIMGGIHVSMLPEEAIQHCDSVIIGEAEEIWHQVLKDAQNKKLQKFYKVSQFPELSSSPIPRWDLIKNDKYCYFTIQTGRGCPYDCEFCLVKLFNGQRYRHKGIPMILNEIETLQRIDSKKLIFFADDNLLAVPRYAEELMSALVSLKIRSWWCQSSVNRLNNDKILDLMYKAGCQAVFIGFESIFKKTLDAMNKSLINQIGEYKKIINKVYSHKISIFGSFVLGSDTDDEAAFQDTVDFINDSNIAFAMVNIITPLPGSKLYDKLNNEGRLLNKHWQNYDVGHVCFRPLHTSPSELNNIYINTVEEIYSYDALYNRLKNLWSQNIYLKDTKTKSPTLLSKGRIKLTLSELLNKDKFRRRFVMRSLWNKHITSITSILLALGFNEYSRSIKNNKNV